MAAGSAVGSPRRAAVVGRWHAVRSWLDERSPRATAGLVLLTLAAVYLSTTNWHQAQINDTVATIHPAHQLAFHGTWVLDEPPPDNPWFLPVEGGYVSNRFPGAILFAVPAYRLLGDPEVVTTQPGAVTAALLAAAAMTALHLVLRRVTTPTRATVGALVAGLATSTWGISAAAVWTHTVTQLWLALAVLALARERYLRSGLAFGVSLLARPQTAVIAAVVGLVRSWQARSLRPATWIGLGSSVGLAAYLVYNATVLGGAPGEEVTAVTGGYGDNPLRSLVGMPLGAYVVNVLQMLLNPYRGVLVLSPFLVVLLVTGGRSAWRAAPDWVRAAALAAVVYLLLQARVNGFDGGGNQLVYRLPLGPLTVAAPYLALAYDRGVGREAKHARAFWVAASLSVAVQVLAATVWTKPALALSLLGRVEWARAIDLAGPTLIASLLASVVAVGVVTTWLVASPVDATVPEHDDAP